MLSRILIFSSLVLITSIFGCKPAAQTEVGSLQVFDFATISDGVEMDFQVDETSGLVTFKDQLWTINDSKNAGVIYRIDPATGDLLDQIDLKTTNTDWEDLAIDSTFFYVADIGNNLGARQYLSIYRFPIGLLDGSAPYSIDTIAFSFPDQKSFPGTYDHNFDAEAIVVEGGHIFLFSKNWQNKKCKLYKIINTPGVHDAALVSEFNTQGLITAATENPATREIYLLGYNYNGVNTPFIWVLSDYQNEDYFSGNKVRYDIDLNRQTEAIAVLKDGTVVISAEQSRAPAPGLWNVKLESGKSE